MGDWEVLLETCLFLMSMTVVSWSLQIFIGQRLVEKTKIYNEPGVYTEVIPCPDKPVRAAVTIKLALHPNLCFEDTRYMR